MDKRTDHHRPLTAEEILLAIGETEDSFLEEADRFRQGEAKPAEKAPARTTPIWSRRATVTVLLAAACANLFVSIAKQWIFRPQEGGQAASWQAAAVAEESTEEFAPEEEAAEGEAPAEYADVNQNVIETASAKQSSENGARRESAAPAAEEAAAEAAEEPAYAEAEEEIAEEEAAAEDTETVTLHFPDGTKAEYRFVREDAGLAQECGEFLFIHGGARWYLLKGRDDRREMIRIEEWNAQQFISLWECTE